MFRIFLSLILALQMPMASAGTYEKFFQRRAMSRVVSKFGSAMTKAERREFFDTHLATERAETLQDKDKRLDEIAVTLVDATGRFVHAARDNRIEDVRQNLRDVLVQLVRAAGTTVVFTNEEQTNDGCGVLLLAGASTGAMFITGLLMSMMMELNSAGQSSLHFFGGSFLAVLVSLGLTAPRHHVPGTAHVSHVLGKGRSMDSFWIKVDHYLRTDPRLATKKIEGIEDFREILERELRGVTLDQACASVLLEVPSGT